MESRKKLGEILLEAGIIDKFQLKAALAEQAKWGGRLGNHLVQMGILTEELLVKGLSTQLKIPNLDLAAIDSIPKHVLKLVPQELAEKFHLMPVAVKTIKNKKTLIVAMGDPTNLDAIDELRFRTGYVIKAAVAGDTAIEMAIRKHYYGEMVEATPSEPIDFEGSQAPAGGPPAPPAANRQHEEGASAGLQSTTMSEEQITGQAPQSAAPSASPLMDPFAPAASEPEQEEVSLEDLGAEPVLAEEETVPALDAAPPAAAPAASSEPVPWTDSTPLEPLDEPEPAAAAQSSPMPDPFAPAATDPAVPEAGPPMPEAPPPAAIPSDIEATPIDDEPLIAAEGPLADPVVDSDDTQPEAEAFVPESPESAAPPGPSEEPPGPPAGVDPFATAEPPEGAPMVAESPVVEPMAAEPPPAEPPPAEPPPLEPPPLEPPVAEPPPPEPPVAEPPAPEPPAAAVSPEPLAAESDSQPLAAEPPSAEPPSAEPPSTEPPSAEPAGAEPAAAEAPQSVAADSSSTGGGEFMPAPPEARSQETGFNAAGTDDATPVVDTLASHERQGADQLAEQTESAFENAPTAEFEPPAQSTVDQLEPPGESPSMAPPPEQDPYAPPPVFGADAEDGTDEPTVPLGDVPLESEEPVDWEEPVGEDSAVPVAAASGAESQPEPTSNDGAAALLGPPAEPLADEVDAVEAEDAAGAEEISTTDAAWDTADVPENTVSEAEGGNGKIPHADYVGQVWDYNEPAQAEEAAGAPEPVAEAAEPAPPESPPAVASAAEELSGASSEREPTPDGATEPISATAVPRTDVNPSDETPAVTPMSLQSEEESTVPGEPTTSMDEDEQTVPGEVTVASSDVPASPAEAAPEAAGDVTRETDLSAEAAADADKDPLSLIPTDTKEGRALRALASLMMSKGLLSPDELEDWLETQK